MGLLVHDAGGPAGFPEVAQVAQVAIEVGSPFQSFLWKKFGYDSGRVKAVPYGGSVGPFLSDPGLVQQAYITSEPCVAEAKGTKTRFLPAKDAGWNPYGTLLAVGNPAPAWTEAFVAATQRSWEAYLADPSRANAEIGRLNPQLGVSLLACISARQEPFLRGTDGLGMMKVERWEAMATQLVELGLLPPGSSAQGAWLAPGGG